MNALELADEFQNRQNWKLINYIHWSEQSETMLRQLQAEIEALKDKSHNVIIRSSKQIAEFENQIEVLRNMIVNRDEIIDRLDLK